MKTSIRNERLLFARIKDLEKEKQDLEVEIVRKGEVVYDVIKDPSQIIKRTARELATDNNFRKDALSIALNLLANYAGKKINESPTIGRITENILDKMFREKSETDEGENLLQKIVSIFRKDKPETD